MTITKDDGVAQGNAAQKNVGSKPDIDVHDGVVLLDSGVNFVGEQVHYPKGVAKIKSMLATMEPGQTTG